jgi:hypothetical protein
VKRASSLVAAESFAGLATKGDAIAAVPIAKATKIFMQSLSLSKRRTLREGAGIVQRQAERRSCFKRS